MRFLVLLLSALILAACTPESETLTKKEKEEQKVQEEATKKSDKKKKDEEEEEIEEEQSPFAYKLNFDKEVLLIHLSEENNSALSDDRPIGGMTSQSAFVYEGNLNLFHEAELPTAETKSIVLVDKFNLDYSIDFELYQSSENVIEFDLNEIKNVEEESESELSELEDDELAEVNDELTSEEDEPTNKDFVVNENRLFNGAKVRIEYLNNGSILVSINNEQVTIEQGEEKEISRSRGEIESTIKIKNYGLINSIENISYQFIEGMDEEEDESEKEGNESTESPEDLPKTTENNE